MGQAKERKARLGEWYGHPIGPGHPDFVAPKKPEPIRPLLRFGPIVDLGMTIETKIEQFRVYAGRVEVEFVNGRNVVLWPSPNMQPAEGELRIGSRNFGIVKLDLHTETGCVFIRSQAAQEEPSKSEPIEPPSDERSAQEEPNVSPQRAARTMPNRRRIPLIFSALAVAAIGMSSIPEPEYRPKKR